MASLSDLFNKQNGYSEELTKRESGLDETEKIDGPYLYDLTAIVNSLPFRRLKHKTQVFFAPRNDHICTRMEHVFQVSLISLIIARGLNTKAKINLDLDLVSAIALGHDVGHAPFGHLGETVLTDLATDQGIDLKCGKEGHAFKHELYARRMIDELARYLDRKKGLNLTYAVRDGIICHCGEEFEPSITPEFKIKDLKEVKERAKNPSTLEACIVRIVDKIAYIPRDIEDAIRLGLIKIDEIPKEILDFFAIGNNEEKINNRIVNNLITNLIDHSICSGKISLSIQHHEILKRLYDDFNMKKIYLHSEIQKRHIFVKILLRDLFEELYRLLSELGFDQIAGLRTERFKEKKRVLYFFGEYVDSMKSVCQDKKLITFDYIAGMTDNFALDAYEDLFKRNLQEYIMF